MIEEIDFFESLKNRVKEPFFLQVGAMDGVYDDPLYEIIEKYHWPGLLIEPLPDIFEKLKQNYRGHNNLIYENVAITDHVEECIMYRITEDQIQQNKLPEWLSGCSTLQTSMYQKNPYHSHFIETKVKCSPLKNILNKHQITKIDIVISDTEGFDYIVFKQLDFSIFNPYLILIEVEHLNENDQDKMFKKLNQLGYNTNTWELYGNKSILAVKELNNTCLK